MRVCLEEKTKQSLLHLVAKTKCLIGWSVASWLSDLEGKALLSKPK